MLAQQQYNVQYVNAFPGSGKTHWLQKMLVKYIATWQKRKDAKQYDKLLSMPQLMICVFPTNALINEVLAKITAKIRSDETLANCADVLCKKLVPVTYDLLQEKQMYSKHNTVKMSLHKYAISFNNQCLNLAESIIAEGNAAHAKAAHRFKSLLDSRINIDEDLSDYYLCPGNVLFITQLAFWTANHSEFSSTKSISSFANKHLCNVYIDEARSCQMSSISLKLSNVAKEYLSTLVSFNSNSYTAISSSVLLANEVKAKLLDLFSLREAMSFISFLEQQSYAFIKLTGSSLTVVVIQVPYDALIHWRRITLMSAFFEESQMYAVIRCMHNIQKLGYKINLVDVTDKIISKERQQALLNRFSSATISYVFDTYCNASKNLYNKGVVFKCDEQQLEKEYAHVNTIYSYVQKSKKLPSLAIYLNNFNHQKDNIPTLAKDSPKALLNPTIAVLCKEIKTFSTSSPIQAAVELSVDYAKRWLSDNNLASSDQLCNNRFLQKQILINYNKTLSYPPVSSDTLISSSLQSQYTKLHGDVRGLNKYSDFSIISVLSAFNLETSILSWFYQYCVDTKNNKVFKYNAYLDFTLGQYIQTMLRCSLRNINSNDKVLILVSTKKLAYDLNAVIDNVAAVKSPVELFGKNTPICTVKTSKSCAANLPEYIIERNKKIRAQQVQSYRKSQKFLIYQINKAENTSEKEFLKEAYLDFHFNKSPKCLERAKLNSAVYRLKKNKENSAANASKLVNLLIRRDRLQTSIKELRQNVLKEFTDKYAQYTLGDTSVFSYLAESISSVKLRQKKKIEKAKQQLSRKR